MEKQCIICGPKDIHEFGLDTRCSDGHKSRCKLCQREYHQKRRRDNPAEYARKAKNWRECTKEIRYMKAREYRQSMRMAAFRAYCGENIHCMCLGGCSTNEPKFLAIDHIEGGGREHRRQIGTNGLGIYSWLRANKYPPGFQVLCHNCNLAKGAYGQCPHIE